MKTKDLQKICKSCGLTLPLESFPIGKNNSGGRRPQCKPCYSKYTYEKRNPEVCARASKKYAQTEHGKETIKANRHRTSETRAAHTKRWRERMRAEGKLADLNRKYSYGISPEQYAAMCERDPVCAICGRDSNLVVDHDHETEKVRGRLCCNCNTAIGKLGDSAPLLMRAVKYLEERTC